MTRRTYFYNSTPIDLAAIAVMGVSVKEGDNPIGYFGTGLKFALATLLRTGHQVRLHREGVLVEFRARPETIRGQEFQRVYMDCSSAGAPVEALGFTTNLGRNWEVWMAYRELRSNAMDEQGGVAPDVPPGEWGTVFEVLGDPLAECHDRGHEVFLEGTPTHADPECDVHDRPSRVAFYRGVRAMDLDGLGSLLTYNVRSGCTLTEDRTIKAPWEVAFRAVRSLGRCASEELLYRVLTAERGSFESALNWEHLSARPSVAFMTVCERNRHRAQFNLSAVRVWEKYAEGAALYTQAQLTAYEEGTIQSALVLVRRLMPHASREDFIVVDGMGPKAYGMHRRGRTFIARTTLDLGTRFTASTIWEELLHSKEGMEDESRALQNILFEKVMTLTERLMHYEPDPPASRGAAGVVPRGRSGRAGPSGNTGYT